MTRRISVVLFDGFELLDVCGPVELLSHVEGITLDFVGPEAGLVSSAQGLRVECARSFRELSKEPIDILLVPGGPGTRTLVDDAPFLAWLTEAGARARLLASVCTGSALLAAAGLLEGYRATSNKAAFEWARTFGQTVAWQREARWVEDRDRWTSSGVAAGMDMTAALIASLCGPEARDRALAKAEYTANTDSDSDPFAAVPPLP